LHLPKSKTAHAENKLTFILSPTHRNVYDCSGFTLLQEIVYFCGCTERTITQLVNNRILQVLCSG
jgi:hypothetical protein